MSGKLKGSQVDLSKLIEGSPVFLYQLSGIGGSQALSPHPEHWANLIREHGDKLGQCAPGMACLQDQLWEAWLENNS